IDLHTDESSPHFHVVVTPIKDGKLQAKAWLDGASKVDRVGDVERSSLGEVRFWIFSPIGLVAELDHELDG
ncbi:plasmid recombination protein, partial [Aeromonas caviae]|uniref:plasmid recombination protein n=1 Tax=Aeromonas caviae TaxID=648 RepID=UPI001CC740EC